MLAQIQERLARGVRRAAYSTGAGICFLVGAAFLTAAAWIYLARTTSPELAALIIGAVWLGFGFILLGLGSAGRAPRHAPPVADPHRPPEKEAPPSPPSGFGLAQAFLFGLEAGRGTARKK